MFHAKAFSHAELEEEMLITSGSVDDCRICSVARGGRQPAGVLWHAVLDIYLLVSPVMPCVVQSANNADVFSSSLLSMQN